MQKATGVLCTNRRHDDRDLPSFPTRRSSDLATALAGISAALPPARIIGLVGPDGAGKTTLIRLLAGLMQPTAGTVEVLGDRKSTRLNSSHQINSYAVLCLKNNQRDVAKLTCR